MAVKRDNFGEEIGNSKAQAAMLRQQNLSYSDVVSGWSEVLKNKYIVKQKIFPTPNYEKIRENCSDRFVMSYIKAVYDGLPSTPQVSREELRSSEYSAAQNKSTSISNEMYYAKRNIRVLGRKEQDGTISDYEAQQLAASKAKIPELEKKAEEANKEVNALFATYMEHARENYITAIRTVGEKLTECKTPEDCMKFRKWIEPQASNFFSIQDQKLREAVQKCNEDIAGHAYFSSYFKTEADKKEFKYTIEDKTRAHYEILKYDRTSIHEERVNGDNIALAIQRERGTSFYYSYPPIRTWEENKYVILDNNRKIIGINFESEKAAFAYALELEQQKAAEAENKPKKTNRRKEKFKPNSLTHIYRYGEDYLEGKDVVIRQKHDEKGNPMYVMDNDNHPVLNDKNEKIPVLECPAFQDYLGFSAGEFGKWENQEERKENLNRAYCAFLDLAKALDIEDSDISLGNKLSIAFGSRGSGAAVAHFEPLHNVINITKLRGAGALGHEWAHALDYYVARESSYTSTFASGESSHLYKTVMADVMKTITTSPNGGYTEFYKNAKELDGKYEKYSEGYWSSSEELFARAFHCYIEHKLEEKGEHNDYLCGLASNSPMTYPQGEEADRIYAAMDKMIVTLKEKGVLHQRTERSKPKTLIESDYIIADEEEKKPRKPKDSSKQTPEQADGQQELPVDTETPVKENSPAPAEAQKETKEKSKQEEEKEPSAKAPVPESSGSTEKPVNWNSQEQKEEGFTSDLFSTLDDAEPEYPSDEPEVIEDTQEQELDLTGPEQPDSSATQEDLNDLLKKFKQDLEESVETKKNLDNMIAEVQGILLADKLMPGDIIYFGERNMIDAASMKETTLPPEFAKVNSVSERSISFTTYDSIDCKHETGRETIFSVDGRTWQTELASRKYKPVSIEAMKGPTEKILCTDIVYYNKEEYSETYESMRALAVKRVMQEYQKAQTDIVSRGAADSEMLFSAMKPFDEAEHLTEIEKLANTYLNHYINRDSNCIVEIPKDTPPDEKYSAIKRAIQQKENCECNSIGYYRPAQEIDIVKYEALSDLETILRSQNYEVFLELKAAMPEASAANIAKLAVQGCTGTELHTEEEWNKQGYHVVSDFGYDIMSVSPVKENNDVVIKCEPKAVFDISHTDKPDIPKELSFYRFQKTAISEVAAEFNVSYQSDANIFADSYHIGVLRNCAREILKETSSFAGEKTCFSAESSIAAYLAGKAMGIEQNAGVEIAAEYMREIFNLNSMTEYGLEHGESRELAKIVDEAASAAAHMVQVFEKSIEQQKQKEQPLKYTIEDIMAHGRGDYEVINQVRTLVIPVSNIKPVEMVGDRLAREDQKTVINQFMSAGRTEIMISLNKNKEDRTATLGGKEIQLTQKEWDLVEARYQAALEKSRVQKSK